MSCTIPTNHYDGQTHAVPYEIGRDFVEKRRAYLADGFTTAFSDGRLLVCKIMEGDPIPPLAPGSDERRTQL